MFTIEPPQINHFHISLCRIRNYNTANREYKATDNSRNGYNSKTLNTSFGNAEIAISRNLKGEFDPQILKENHMESLGIICCPVCPDL